MPRAEPPILSGKDDAVVAATCAAHGVTRAEFDALRTAAVAAKGVAYCPYSKFRVGAALLPLERRTVDATAATADAEGISVIKGCNVENASYPVGMCAERVGFGAAVAQGVTKFKALAVSTDISPPASPCGMCRQAYVFLSLSLSNLVTCIMREKKKRYSVEM